MEFHFFWKGPLSQWAPSKFYDPRRKLWFVNAEQYMMYEKAKFFKDEEIASLIMQTTSPREHQKLGRQVRNFDQARWDMVAQAIVKRGNLLKFTQNADLLEILFNFNKYTKFVEASPVDKIWGIGMAEDNPDVNDPTKWKGLNWLGMCITAVRDDLLKLYNMK